MLDSNRKLIDQFNKEEQKYQRLQRRKRARRKKLPLASKKLHKLLDRLDVLAENHQPVDCVSKKWIES